MRLDDLALWYLGAPATPRYVGALKLVSAGKGVSLHYGKEWLIKRDGELGSLAAPEHDQGALEMDVRAAIDLGRSRAQSSAEARLRAVNSADKTNN